MLTAGHYYTLQVTRLSDHGLYLGDEQGEEEIAEREKFFLDGGMSRELAAAMARVMLSLEKISKRRK